MAADRLTDSIASLEERIKALKNRRAKRDARRRFRTKQRTRKEETRRKILVGAIVLAKVEQQVFDGSTLLNWLDAALTQPADRELFELDGPPSLDALVDEDPTDPP